MFSGFPPEITRFFEDLRDNNNKAWFDDHRADFDQYVMEPARAFVNVMGMRLKALSPDVQAVPKVNQSLFRLHRDTRFSDDKTPFKTNLAMVFWEGKLKRMENTSFYFHYEPPNLLLGAGIYRFSKPVLSAYRDYVAHPPNGKALRQIIDDLESMDGYNSVWGKNYKKVPRGYDADYEHADLLLYDGLTIGYETPTPDVFYTPEIVDYCFEQWQKMLPLEQWLVKMTDTVDA